MRAGTASTACIAPSRRLSTARLRCRCGEGDRSIPTRGVATDVRPNLRRDLRPPVHRPRSSADIAYRRITRLNADACSQPGGFMIRRVSDPRAGRRRLAAAGAVIALLVAGCGSDDSTPTASTPSSGGNTIKVGILHSLSSFMAISEVSVRRRRARAGADARLRRCGRPCAQACRGAVAGRVSATGAAVSKWSDHRRRSLDVRPTPCRRGGLDTRQVPDLDLIVRAGRIATQPGAPVADIAIAKSPGVNLAWGDVRSPRPARRCRHAQARSQRRPS